MGEMCLGIVGTGYIADVIAAALRTAEGIRLSAVSSRSRQKAVDFATRHGGAGVEGK